MSEMPKAPVAYLRSAPAPPQDIRAVEWLQRENRTARAFEGVAGLVFIVFVIFAIAVFLFLRMPAHFRLLQ